MRQNITRVQERGENVDRLGDKTQGLSDSAANFRRGANRVRKQMFWKNMKMRVWLIIGVIVLILLIAIPSKHILPGSLYQKLTGCSCGGEGEVERGGIGEG